MSHSHYVHSSILGLFINTNRSENAGTKPTRVTVAEEAGRGDFH